MQAVYNIAEICARKHVTEFVLSPGSRCAPLTIALARHPSIRTRTIGDERSAAFIAIGISQQTKRTTGLVCTSGSAAYNYAPAIAEAYYQQIPLLVLTADRPPEWIDQNDGQTIRQNGIYGGHVKRSFTFPADTSHPDARWEAERMVSEAINLSMEYPAGPVHINIPLREPLYPQQELVFEKKVKVIDELFPELSLSPLQQETLLEELRQYEKVLIIGGQHEADQDLLHELSLFASQHHVPVAGDIISNLSKEGVIHFHDTILGGADENLLGQLRPDLIITFGKSLISKSLKTFLRKHRPAAHWHLQPSGHVADTFQALTRIIHIRPASFFRAFTGGNWKKPVHYLESWKHAETKAHAFQWDYFRSEKPFNEFQAVYETIRSIPARSILHLANSMPVRYANYITLRDASAGIEVFANRGTSGIDGTISTALGAAVSADRMVTVITGDMAFFYDRNAWWNKYIPANLRVILLNNHGGGIFRIIDGPSAQPELEEYFETTQTLLAENTARDFQLDYSFCNSEEMLRKALQTFFDKSDRAKILEIETDSRTNTEVFRSFKKDIRTLYEK